MNSRIAESTSILLVKVNAALDAQLANIQRQCQPEEFELQRRLFGATMARLLDILNQFIVSIRASNPRDGRQLHLAKYCAKCRSARQCCITIRSSGPLRVGTV